MFFLILSGGKLWSTKEEKTCECREPCRITVYEKRLSYASLSGISLSQILSSDLAMASSDREKALDVTYKTDIDLYRRLFSEWRSIINGIDFFLETTESVFSEGSVLSRVDQALNNLSNLCLEDIQQSLGQRLEEYIIAQETYFEPYQKHFLIASQNMISNLQLFIINYQYTMSNMSSYGPTFLKRKLAKSKELIGNFDEAIKHYINFLQPGTIASFKNLQPNVAPALPDVHFHKEDCINVINSSQLNLESLHAAVEELEKFLQVDRLENGFQTLIVLNKELSLMRNDVLPKATVCINDYYNLLQGLKKWQAEQLDSLHQVVVKTKSRAVNNTLWFFEAAATLKSFSQDAKEHLKEYQGGNIRIKQFIESFPVEDSQKARTNFNILQINLVNNILKTSQTDLAEMQRVVTASYIDLVQHDHILSLYFKEDNATKPITKLILWKRPQPHEDLGGEILFSDAMYIKNSERFSQDEAPKLVGNLISWYTDPLDRALTNFQVEVNQQVRKIMNSIELVLKSIQELSLELRIDEDFVK